MIFVKLGVIFDLAKKLKCIPGVKLPKYAYTLIHLDTVAPPPPLLNHLKLQVLLLYESTFFVQGSALNTLVKCISVKVRYLVNS